MKLTELIDLKIKENKKINKEDFKTILLDEGFELDKETSYLILDCKDLMIKVKINFLEDQDLNYCLLDSWHYSNWCNYYNDGNSLEKITYNVEGIFLILKRVQDRISKSKLIKNKNNVN